MDFKKFSRNSRNQNKGTENETSPILSQNNSEEISDWNYTPTLSNGKENPKNFIQSDDTESTDLAHCYAQKIPATKVDKVARRKLIFASILCLFFMIAEGLGGWFSDSLAIMTDAAHLLADFASFMISLFSIWITTCTPTKTMTFGYNRAEVIGALTSVIMIWVVTGILVYMAIGRLIVPEYNLKPEIMLITAGFGLAVNLIMGIALHGVGHEHSHDSNASNHSFSSHTNLFLNHEEPKENINVRAAFIHVIGDFFQSLGVLVAAAVIYYTGYLIIDPMCTFLFSALVIFTTLTILRDALIVLMEGVPKRINLSEIHTTLMSINGVRKIHNLRIWALTMDRVVMTVHLVIDTNVNPQDVLKETMYLMKSYFNIFELTVQIENYTPKMQDNNK